jgi:hypothetical protein
VDACCYTGTQCHVNPTPVGNYCTLPGWHICKETNIGEPRVACHDTETCVENAFGDTGYGCCPNGSTCHVCVDAGSPEPVGTVTPFRVPPDAGSFFRSRVYAVVDDRIVELELNAGIQASIIDPKTLSITPKKLLDPAPINAKSLSVIGVVGTSMYVMAADDSNQSAPRKVVKYDVAADAFELLAPDFSSVANGVAVPPYLLIDLMNSGRKRIDTRDGTLTQIADPPDGGAYGPGGSIARPAGPIIGSTLYFAYGTPKPGTFSGTWPATMFAYDAEANSWKVGTSVSGKGPLSPTALNTIFLIDKPLADGKLLAITATTIFDGTGDPPVYEYDPTADTWTPDKINGAPPTGKYYTFDAWPYAGISNGSIVWILSGYFYDPVKKTLLRAPPPAGAVFSLGGMFFSCDGIYGPQAKGCIRIEPPNPLPCP